MESAISVDFDRALQRGNKQGIQIWISKAQSGEIDVNAQDFGRTALMYAAIQNAEEAVKELLKVPRIEVNAKNEYGSTALMLAIKGNSEK